MRLSCAETHLASFLILWLWVLACAPVPSPAPLQRSTVIRGAAGPTPERQQHGASPSRRPSSGASGREATRTPLATLSGVESRTLAGINTHRISIGLPALRGDSVLAEIARVHSRAMADGRRPFGHERMSSRTARVRAYMPSRRVAENVSKSSRALNRVADAAVEGWLASSVHLRNIDGPYSTSGIGAARNSDGVTFMTQIFAGD